jgi:hypothetical protein
MNRAFLGTQEKVRQEVREKVLVSIGPEGMQPYWQLKPAFWETKSHDLGIKAEACDGTTALLMSHHRTLPREEGGINFQ